MADPAAQLAAISRWTRFGSVAEIRAMLRKLSGLHSSEARQLARILLLKEWIAIDPTGILDDSEAPKRVNDAESLAQIALLWAERDPDGAISALLKHPVLDWKRDSILSSVVAQVSADDPMRALALLEKHQLFSERLYEPAFNALAEENIENAVRLAEGIKDVADPQRIAGSSSVGRRAAALSAVANEWVRSDPMAAIAWLNGLEDSDGRSVKAATEETLSHWATHDPQTFLNNRSVLPDDSKKSWLMSGAIAQWWGEDPTAALSWLEDSVDDPELTQKMLGTIAMEAGRSDPSAAFEMAKDLPRSDERRKIFSEIAKKTALDDPAATASWVSSLEDPADRLKAARSALGAIAERDPAAAVEHFAALAPHLGSSNPYVFGHTEWDDLIPHLAQGGIADATSWLETIPTAQKDDALKTLAKVWSESDPQAAADYLSAQADSKNQVRATQEVLRHWTKQQPAAAASWVENLPEGQNRELAAKNIASNWAAIDPDAGARWIEGLPASKSRDRAAEVFAKETASTNPQRAFELASSIGDARARKKTVKATLKKWRRFDEKAATAAAAKSPD